MGYSKTAGSSAPRFHWKPLGSGSWSHGDANQGSPLPLGNQAGDITRFIIGSLGGGSLPWNGRMACVALFGYALTDADWVSIQTTPSSQQLANLGAVTLWDLNQTSVATAVSDLVGSANQTGITGTTAVTGDDPPGWTFGVTASAPSPVITPKYLSRLGTRRRPYAGRASGY
jgi:hypothetical protein